MKDKFCCNTWLAMVDSVRVAKECELGGVSPEYLVTPVLKMLHNINKYCPVCGESLDETNEKISRPSPRQGALPHTPAPRSNKCVKCNGMGKLGNDENGVPLSCRVCYGIGTVKPTFKTDIKDQVTEAKANAEKGFLKAQELRERVKDTPIIKPIIKPKRGRPKKIQDVGDLRP